MLDRGFWITRQAVRSQRAAMPNDLYLVRSIHRPTAPAWPGERLWTAHQLASTGVIGFLRLKNSQGCDIYFRPWAADHNAGYLLLDFDHGHPATMVEALHRDGFPPLYGGSQQSCRQGHRGSPASLGARQSEPAGPRPGHRYRPPFGPHLPSRSGQRRRASSRPIGRIHQPETRAPHYRPTRSLGDSCSPPGSGDDSRPAPPTASITTGQALSIYHHYVRRWRIFERFPHPDYYLRRTLSRAAVSPAGAPERRVWGGLSRRCSASMARFARHGSGRPSRRYFQTCNSLCCTFFRAPGLEYFHSFSSAPRPHA
jgi:hypothetical protein